MKRVLVIIACFSSIAFADSSVVFNPIDVLLIQIKGYVVAVLSAVVGIVYCLTHGNTFMRFCFV